VQHHGGEPVPAFDLVENADDAIAFSTCPPAESRKRTTRFKSVSYLPTAVRRSSAMPATIGPDHSISSLPFAWLNSSDIPAGF
jgi:hypothetical protein